MAKAKANCDDGSLIILPFLPAQPTQPMLSSRIYVAHQDDQCMHAKERTNTVSSIIMHDPDFEMIIIIIAC